MTLKILKINIIYIISTMSTKKYTISSIVMFYTYYYTYIIYKTRICTHTRVYIESFDNCHLTSDEQKKAIMNKAEKELKDHIYDLLFLT